MATTAADPPLDEIVHRRPDMIQWWLDPEQYKPGVEPPHTYMEERFVHRYFSESPFFDPTTKNGLLFGQSAVNFETYELVHNAARLESILRNRPGLEYVIAERPQQVPAHEHKPAQPSGVWVLRKQQRLEDQTGATRDSPYPNTETRGTYYIVNESVYQAPSVADVVGNRMLSAVTSLEKMFVKTATLPSFTPTTGHTYLPPRTISTATATAGASTQGSPNRSREGSVVPGASAETQSLRSGSLAPELAATSNTTDNDLQTARILVDSLQKSMQFSEEYVDENPLVGEPGNFRFTSSAAAVKKRKADEEAVLIAAQKAKEAKETSSSSTAATPKVVKAPTPPPVFTEARATAKTDKDRREEKKRRRKSRPNVGGNTTPSTPKGPSSAITPKGTG
ncbi:Mediator of RNA polymerase II transcription subunit 6 [Recurvomyces mirabilis]|nr:Mediator of RNA polymerase II transcription subunit 6 [Recurvomyces mirabilis]